MTDKKRIIALIIWLCEGTKLRKDKRWKNSYIYSVEVINSDPKIIKIFTDFLRNELKVSPEKLRGQIQIHEGDNQQGIEDFWLSYINIKRSQLEKTIIRKKGNKPGKTKGTFKLRIYNKTLFLKLKDMLDKEIAEIL